MIKDNVIEKVKSHPQLHPNAPLFELINCKNIVITGNKYKGTYLLLLKLMRRVVRV